MFKKAIMGVAIALVLAGATVTVATASSTGARACFKSRRVP